MNCNCQTFSDLVDLRAHRDFLIGMAALGNKGWRNFYQCIRCQQKWIVDVDDGRIEIYAIRGDDIDQAEKDREHLIKKYMVQNRGGYQEEKCIWQDCENKRVKGFMMCVDHLYSAGHRK
jgi:hypothetical protein